MRPRETARRLGLLTAVVAAGALAAVPSARAAEPDAFYGTLSDHMGLTRDESRAEMDRQAATGLGVIRLHVFWDRVETAPNSFFWAKLDEIVADAADRGLRILPLPLTTPSFYVTKPEGAKPNLQFPPDDPAVLGRFMQTLIERYGPNGRFWCGDVLGVPGVECRTPYLPITAFQVWNEPNLAAWWKGASNPAEYAALLRSVASHVRSISPTMEIVAAGLAPTPGWTDYLEALYAEGAATSFDTLAMHAYGPQPEDAVNVVRTVRTISEAHDDGTTPIWVTEYGWPTGGQRSLLITWPECQAARIHDVSMRWRALRDELGLRGAIQFQWRDVPTTSSTWPHYAGLFPPDLAAEPKPAAAAFTAAIAGEALPAGKTVAQACATGSAGEPPVSTTFQSGEPGDRETPRFVRRPRIGRRARTLTFTLSEPATVRIVIARLRAGRRVRGVCVAAVRANRRRARCERSRVVRTLTARGTDATTVRLPRRLPRGRYLATATARDASGNRSAAARTRFVVS